MSLLSESGLILALIVVFIWLHATNKRTAECIQHLQAQRHKDENSFLRHKIMLWGVMPPLKNGHRFSQGNLDFQLQVMRKEPFGTFHFPNHFFFISSVHLLSCWDSAPEALVSEQSLGGSAKASVLMLIPMPPSVYDFFAVDQVPVLLHAKPGLWKCSSSKKSVSLSRISFPPCFCQANAQGSMREAASS